MFEKLKRKNLKKFKEKNIAERDVSARNSKLKSLGFLVEERLFQDFEKLYNFSQDLGIQPKDVKVFSFVEVQKTLPSLESNQIHNKEFSWKGEITNQNANEFLDKEFDVLVAMYEENEAYFDLMVSRSNARFKIGFEKMDARLYDIIFKLKPNQFEAFKTEFIKYLKILNKI